LKKNVVRTLGLNNSWAIYFMITLEKKRLTTCDHVGFPDKRQ